MSAADVSVITLSRTPAYFARLLSGLERQDGDLPSYSGVLVNNASSLELTELAVRAGGWAVLDFGYNATYSEGHNAAAKVFPDTQWLLLLNDDLVLERSDFLERLWAERYAAGVVGALLCHADGTVNHAGVDYTIHPKARRPLSEHMGRHDPAEAWECAGSAAVPAITFAAALISLEVWEAVSGLDERYSYGWEDTDFCMKAVEAGYGIAVARGAVAIHDECGTRARSGKLDQDNAAAFQLAWPVERMTAALRNYRGMNPMVEGLTWLSEH